MSGGFTPGLVETVDKLSGFINVLASEHSMSKSVGITLDASKWSADADGDKIVPNGQVVAKITATGLYGPYDNAATDGREDETTTGVIVNGGLNVRHGNTVTGMLIHGSVLRARLTGWTPTLEAAVAGRIIAQ